MTGSDVADVAVIGGGPAGLTAAIFTAGNGLDTVLLDAGPPILARNAHLANYPGFVYGVDPRALLDLMRSQADAAGCDRRDARVTAVADEQGSAAFRLTTADDRLCADRVVAATKNEAGYLDGLDGVAIRDRGKTFVEADERGRTGVDGLYVAGRLAGKPHQAVVAAGHGAEVAVTLLEDADRPFYHDWTAPDGYFTDRGRDVPPGCEEIEAEERRARDERARVAMREALSTPHPREQRTHPSLVETAHDS
jgi:thioredoxin reductase